MHRGRRRSSGRSETAVNIVLDASVVVRAVVDKAPGAREWTARLGPDVQAHAPELLWAEVASALFRYVSTGAIARRQAHELFAYASQLPIETRVSRSLAAPALERAIRGSLSVYDACYVVLAEALGATLVTADRGLGAAYDRAELIA